MDLEIDGEKGRKCQTFMSVKRHHISLQWPLSSSQQLHCNCSRRKGIFALVHQVENTLGHGYALPFGQLTLGGHDKKFCLSRETVLCVVVHQEVLVQTRENWEMALQTHTHTCRCIRSIDRHDSLVRLLYSLFCRDRYF